MIKQLFSKSLLSILMVSLVLPFRANAGIPTIDVTNVIQTTITSIESLKQGVQLYTQINNQVNQIRNQYDQITNQVKQLESLNGDYFKDMLLNNSSYKAKRHLVPKTYKEVLDLYKNIGVAGHQIATNAGWEARDEMQIDDADVYFEDLTTADAKRWQQQENNSMAAVGVADSSFERVDSLIEETELLMEDIKNSTDAKAAQDLSNRMAGQTQLLLAEVIRIQSAQAAAQGRNQLYEHSLRGKEKKMSIFTEIPSLITP